MYSPPWFWGIPYMDQTKSKKAPRQGKKNKNTANLSKLNKELLSEIRSASRRPLANQKSAMSRSVVAPVAQASVRKVAKPSFRNLPEGDIVITHREYINDIAGTIAFANGSFSVNPGLPGTFPWLSGVAQRFESYRFDRLEFEFETQAPTSATGTVLITLDYDASDAAPIDKTQALSYRSCVRSPPWSDCRHTSLPEDLHKEKTHFVRNGALSANQDVKLYDVAVAYVSTQGQANTNAIGELYVSYSVRLMTPQLGDPRIGEALYGLFQGSSNAAPFATVTYGNLPATVATTGTTTSVSTFTFTQPFSGVATLYATGTGLTGSTSGGTGNDVEQAEVVLAAGTSMMAIDTIDCDPGQTYVLTISNTTISAANLWFGQARGEA
jgi:hypothetical protein